MTDATEQNQERTPEAKLEEKRRRAAEAREFLGRLAERYPACFTRDRDKTHPLAIGMQQKLRAELSEQAEFKDSPGWMVRQALAIYTRSPAYLNAIVEKRARINLDGSPAGEVTEQEQQYAQTRLDEINARRAAKRPSKPRPKRGPQERRGPGRSEGKPPRAASAAAQPQGPERAPPRPRETEEERTRRKLQELAAKFSKQ